MTEIETSGGPIVGRTQDGVAAFRGIPYAAAPIGVRRFAPPEPHPLWSEPREAVNAGPAAPQGASMLAPVLGEEPVSCAEDNCLTLNAWTPDPAGRRPILLWLHGGAFVTGYAGGPRQSGSRLAARGDIVVVTTNFRLGPLGYLYLTDGAGNMGLLDQIAALRWVHENAAAFGGDPDRITVGGHSSGALSAAAVAVSPLAAGLARRALLASPQLGSVTTPDRAAAETRTFLDRLGVGAEELRSLPAEQLIKAAEQLAAERGPAGVPPSLVVGGAGLPLDIAGALANSDLDLLIDTARDEARAFLACDPGARRIDQRMATGMLSQLLPGRGQEAYQHYSDRRPGAGPAEIAADALTDGLFRMPVLRLASKRGAYVSQFEWRSTPEFGACHTVDLPFALDNPAVWSDAPLLAGRDTATLQPLADRYSGALAEFVRTGLAPWPRYDAVSRMTMRFDDVVGPVSDPAGPERDLWQVR